MAEIGIRKGALRKKELDNFDQPEYLTHRLFNFTVYYMTDALSDTFAALADPTRRAILARLSSGEASVTELAAPHDMSMPAISKHLKVLEHAGLITRGREAQWRPCRLHAGGLKNVAEWVEHYRRFWEASLDRLDSYLEELKAHERKKSALKKEQKHGRKK
jgi:DNA-binding transcriptional ArsR family regulator